MGLEYTTSKILIYTRFKNRTQVRITSYSNSPFCDCNQFCVSEGIPRWSITSPADIASNVSPAPHMFAILCLPTDTCGGHPQLNPITSISDIDHYHETRRLAGVMRVCCLTGGGSGFAVMGLGTFAREDCMYVYIRISRNDCGVGNIF